MTKYLVKIISICAFVVLLPVIIAGVAVSAIGSQNYNLSAYLSFEGGINQYANAVKMLAGEKGKDKTTLNAGENKISLDYIYDTDVSVSIASYEGYDFIGWFDGDNAKQEFDANKKLSDKLEYGFALTSNAQVTARLKTIEYKITFIDGETQNTQTLKYGEPITPLTNTTEKYFAGWKFADENGQPSGNAFESAIFPETMNRDEIVLVAQWEKAMTIEYYTYDNGEKATEPFEKQILSENDFENFQFITPSKYKDTVLRGYDFDDKWLGENGFEITPESIREGTFKVGEIVKVYMSRTPITYNIKVRKFDTSNEGADVADLTYRIDQGFGEFTLTRNHYTIAGLVYNKVEYTKTTVSDKTDYVSADGKYLSDAIIDGSARDNISIIATWNCEYNTLNFKFFAHAGEEGQPDAIQGVKADGTPVNLPAILDQLGNVYTAIFNGTDKIDMEDSIVQTILGEYVEFKNIDKDFAPVKLKSVKVHKNAASQGPEFSNDVTNDATFVNIVDVLAIYVGDITDDFTINVEFIFE